MTDGVRIEAEKTIPIPFVRFRGTDLDEMARRITALSDVERRAAEAEVEEDLGDLQGDARDRARERELGYRSLSPPTFAVTTKYASFSGSSWPAVTTRVSIADADSIEMDWSTGYRSDRTTSVRIRLEPANRDTSASVNRVYLKSDDPDLFDRELGFYNRLFEQRRNATVERLSTGFIGLVLWRLAPSLTAGLAIQLVLLRVLNNNNKSFLLNDLWSGGFFGVFVALFAWDRLSLIEAKVAPRISGLRGDTSSSGLYQFVFAVVASIVAALVIAIWTEVARSR